MYEDILGSKEEKEKSVDLNKLLKYDKRIRNIRYKKYNSNKAIAIVIDDDKIEREELIEIRDKIVKDTDIKKGEIIFIVKNIIIHLY